MHNATFENIFNIPAKENPLKKISQVLMNAGMGYSLQSLFWRLSQVIRFD